MTKSFCERLLTFQSYRAACLLALVSSAMKLWAGSPRQSLPINSFRLPFSVPAVRALPDHQPPDDGLSGKFAQFMLRSNLAPSHQPRPSPLLPPTAVVSAQLSALQRNDYPEVNAGIDTAYRFTKPYGCEDLLPGQTAQGEVRVRSWGAHEAYLTREQFSSMLQEPPFDVLLGCDSWKTASPLVFQGSKTSNRAMQAVHVMAPSRSAGAPHRSTPSPPPAASGSGSDSAIHRRPAHGSGSAPSTTEAAAAASQQGHKLQAPAAADGPQGRSGHPQMDSSSGRQAGSEPGLGSQGTAATGRSGVSGDQGNMAAGQGQQHQSGLAAEGPLRQWTFTWVLQQVPVGAHKGIWYTVGVRVGDYSV